MPRISERVEHEGRAQASVVQVLHGGGGLGAQDDEVVRTEGRVDQGLQVFARDLDRWTAFAVLALPAPALVGEAPQALADLAEGGQGG